MAIESTERIGTARRLATTWTALGLGAALAIGLIGASAEFSHLAADDAERIFLAMVAELLPGVLAGLCLAGALAAIMSTADSQLLVSAAAIVGDLFGAEQGKHPIARGRLAVIGVLVVALVIARDPESRVLDLVAYAWAGFGATFGPLLLLSLWRPRFSDRAALATLVAGLVSVIVWPLAPSPWSDIYELLPGFSIALAFGFLVNRLCSQQG